MTSIATATVATDINLMASVPRSAGPAQGGGDTRSFTDMLAIATSAELCVELSREGPGDVQSAANLGEGQQEAALPSVADPPLFAMLQLEGQAPCMASFAPGRAEAASTEAPWGAATDQQTTLGRIGLGDAPAKSLPTIGAVQLPWHGSAMAQADTIKTVGGIDRLPSTALSGRPAAASSGTLPWPSTVRHETHLLAAERSTAVVRQIELVGAKGESDAGLPGAGDKLPLEAVADILPGGPALSEVEPVAAQIAGQVAGAWASLRGALPANTATTTAGPVTAASPLPDTASDVVKALRFDLHPAELGEVHVRLSMSRNELRLHLSFSADRAAGIAQADGQALRQALAEGGMSVGQIVIDAIPSARADAQMRQDGPASQVALSGGAMTDGRGGDPERQARQESARRYPLRGNPSEKSGEPSNQKKGMFI